MKRFNYDDDDQDENLFYDMDDDDEDDEEEVVVDDDYEDREVTEAQLAIAEKDLNQRLLNKTIKMLQNSWFWRFRSDEWRCKQIAETYKFMRELLEKGSDEDA